MEDQRKQIESKIKENTQLEKSSENAGAADINSDVRLYFLHQMK